MTRAQIDLLCALKAAKRLAERSRSERLEALVSDAEYLANSPVRGVSAHPYRRWSSTGPLLGALLKICGHLMNDEDAVLTRAPVDEGRARWMVVNTQIHAQFFTFGDTPEAAVRAHLERYAGPKEGT